MNDSTACPMCRSNLEPFISVEDRPMVICSDCRHITWQNMPSEEEVAAHYQKVYSGQHDQKDLQESQREYYMNHLAMLVSLSPRDENVVVDYGCAWPTLLETGVDVEGISRRIGIDFDEGAREYGGFVGIDMFAPHEISQKIEPRSIDIIRFSHVIEHLIDPAVVLDEIRALLRPGGIIYITQPIFPVLETSARPDSIQDAVFPEHLHFFNAISLLNTVERLDAEILEFAAFQNEEEVQAHFDGMMDIERAAEGARPLKTKKPSGFTEIGGYPQFCGENCHLVARVRGAIPDFGRGYAASGVQRWL
ncbi:MAG: hypothetical protein CMF74_18735 [Maricaulis sp.]|nr:hypothetical protein [Maricaulis sp.]MAL11686.1 hypothetical protein [Maricaulis sp.]HAQ33854.1 hypothetical protein [Alphaproteobacteria bacterium]